jgi:hypothetical protein
MHIDGVPELWKKDAKIVVKRLQKENTVAIIATIEKMPESG